MAKGDAQSLRNILELARARRLNGLMTVGHIQGGKAEEGEVFFQTGQPLQARVGHLVGQDALNWLMTWHNITYSVDTDETFQSVSTTNISNRNTSTPPPKYVNQNRMSSPEPGTAQIPPNGSASTLRNTSTPGIEWLVPQKRRLESDVLALPLTRRQRFIYFLVDGRRSVADLARCTGKNTQEVELTLSELREQGLIVV